jgi:site-specific DNA-cytosine methylase
MGAWGTFDPASMAQADVLFSAPPCENNDRFRGFNKQRQMWKQFDLIKQHQYKLVVVEVLLHFKKMEQGEVFRAFTNELIKHGYVVSCKMLFAPDFASSAARRRVYVVGVREDLHSTTGDFVFPVGRSRHHPLSSILEPESFGEVFACEQQATRSLTHLGNAAVGA